MESTAELTSVDILPIVKAIDEHRALGKEERLHFINVLEAHECWGPCFRLLRRSTNSNADSSFDDFIRLAHIQATHLEDYIACANTCATMIQKISLPFSTLKDQVIPAVLKMDDWEHEAVILETAFENFSAKSDRVLCLERLCFLYEKKLHNDRKLQAGYERLLKLDPQNVRALRYFKMIYTQSAEWEAVASILKRLMGAVPHKQELFRCAQELATILLYQLDQPGAALAMIEQHCAESPLDTSMVQFEAYQRMGMLDGCVKVLRNCLINVETNLERAILHFKIGEIEEQRGMIDTAVNEFQTSADLAPDVLDSIEKLIALHIRRGDWNEVVRALQLLQSRLVDRTLLQRVEQAQKRLKDALANLT